MFISSEIILPFATNFVDDLNEALKKIEPQAGLSKTQKGWLCFCILGIAVTNSICWKQFERASLGFYLHASLSWMFRHSKIFWHILLRASVEVILCNYGITEGVLVIDDSDKKRSKSTKRIYKTHKIKDKASGGFINGQSIILLLLVTPAVTIPVGFEFYMPDPDVTAWNKLDEKLRKQGAPKQARPPKSPKNEKYPTKQEVGLRLLEDFHSHHTSIDVKCVIADALYGTDKFTARASDIFGDVQVISRLRKSQNIRFRTKEMNVASYFSKFPGTPQKIRVRGGEEVTVIVGSARLHVCSHGKKRFVIALKYEGEEEYRYLVASDLSWRTLDIVQAHTLRWLVEVFFQDWKSYEGWGHLTKQPDEEGSRRSLILSLLLDHCLLLHPEQLARLENKLPACTVGSLRERVKVESLIQVIRKVILSNNPEEMLGRLVKAAKDIFQLASSKKHMMNRELGCLEPTPSLKYKVKYCLA